MALTDYSDLNVLIIDDFHSFRTALVKNMHALGFRSISSVSTGREAMSLCRRDHYDVILSDYNLGSGKTGQQFLEEIRYYGMVRRADIFMLISADTSRDVVMASYDCEPSDYLSKPVTGKTLENRLKRLMAKRQELVPVYEAIDADENGLAIALLERILQGSSRYTTDCQKLLGELYIKEQRYDEAEMLYMKILEARDLDWAQVGLVDVDIERGKIEQAIDSLSCIVQDYPAYLKAYDCLSKAYTIVEDTEQLQVVLEKAAAISPMSIGRQKLLADTALANGDVEVAMKAYKRTIKYGTNSHYDSVDNYINLAKSIAKIYDNDTDKAQSFSLEAIKLLNNIDNQYEISEEQKIQTKLLHSQINAMNGNKRVSDELFSEAKKLLDDCVERNVENEVEAVNALIASGENQKAKAAVEEMLEYYQDDEYALEKIDPLLEEPISRKGKKLIGSINKKGIEYYKTGEFSESVNYFLKAQKRYPRYVGLKLNLIQAMISAMKKQGYNESYGTTCDNTFKVVERYINSGNEKYQRYKQLKLMYRQVVVEFEQQKKREAQENLRNA